MTLNKQIADWLESRWITPAYSGWVLIGVTICFFGAAVNTMAGWLYVLSGLGFALLGIAAVLPARSLRGIKIHRSSIQPVSAGEALTVEIEIANPTVHPKNLLQIQDLLPFVLGKPVQAPIEVIPPNQSYTWIYHHPTQQRGVYRWHNVQLRTAAPVGLFWCRRQQEIPATAIVYPTVLPLTTCPIIDSLGQENHAKSHEQQRVQLATEGLTRSLRPYRKGDPLRLIHWRSSARYGEFRVRELELITEGRELVICLDSAGTWEEDSFEQAVIAAASLYFYAQKQQLSVQLWTAATGLVQGNRAVLHTLAVTNSNESQVSNLPQSRLIWLSQNVLSLNTIPSNSYWLLWGNDSVWRSKGNYNSFGLLIDKDQFLQPQLQKVVQVGRTA
ncbi:DUF58 domain-containing protein [Gloeocapsopsis dulcis]|uniref:DUF58 domain-containing protein n=1 Tax=Gloeocapsopsis dulcis AAB1 = 1H9 TaxID=1433147 RepID=A0A6N8FS12_9CHRO|nr:DUF58 domain-containing protein [Gloeocapsopsis dulcis]MUL35362.1 DUF58 domain-containing protein [Gloeocapsopsis dulcis AAB1 = 1H9]WNN90435.1 DUF58 domain-containing protein [Gloeocapsopsis dulcis]